MLYNTFRYLLWVMYVCFFRRVYLLNFENIPKKKPTIIATNHSNGFMDPILIAAMQWRPVWFWVGASELGKGIKYKMMTALHGIPVYRKREGNMHKNKETFRRSKDLMYKGDVIYLAPEGKCIKQKCLEPFKTGCARLAFEMMEEKNWEIDMHIVPSGLNYTHHEIFRSEVYVKIGTPIRVLDYKDAYLADSKAATVELTADLQRAVREQMIYIEKGNLELTEKILPLVRNEEKRSVSPLYVRNNFSLFHREQQVANYISQLDKSQHEELATKVDTYTRMLEQEAAADFAVANKNNRSIFWVLLGFPFWLLGTLSGRLPHVLARDLRNKFVPFVEFSTSFAFTAAWLIWIVWSLVVIVGAAFFIGWWALLLPILMVALQFYAYHYQDYYRDWADLQQYNKVLNKSALESQRQKIIQEILA